MEINSLSLVPPNKNPAKAPKPAPPKTSSVAIALSPVTADIRVAAALPANAPCQIASVFLPSDIFLCELQS